MQNDSYNRGGYIAFLFSMVFSLAFFIYVSVIQPGVDLKEVPEVSEVTQTLVDVNTIERPWEANVAIVEHGKKVYSTNCSVCHGDTGLGDGAAGKALQPPPRNLVEGQWKRGGDSIALFTTLTEGLPGTSMAAFGHLAVVDRWSLVQYIHSITKNPAKDDAAKVEAFAKSAK